MCCLISLLYWTLLVVIYIYIYQLVSNWHYTLPSLPPKIPAAFYFLLYSMQFIFASCRPFVFVNVITFWRNNLVTAPPEYGRVSWCHSLYRKFSVISCRCVLIIILRIIKCVYAINKKKWCNVDWKYVGRFRWVVSKYVLGASVFPNIFFWVILLRVRQSSRVFPCNRSCFILTEYHSHQ